MSKLQINLIHRRITEEQELIERKRLIEKRYMRDISNIESQLKKLKRDRIYDRYGRNISAIFKMTYGSQIKMTLDGRPDSDNIFLSKVKKHKSWSGDTFKVPSYD